MSDNTENPKNELPAGNSGDSPAAGPVPRKPTIREYTRHVKDQAPATFWISVACTAIFLIINLELLTLATTRFYRLLAADIFSYWTTNPWSILTSAFVHRGLVHLFFNMYWFLLFGPIFEKELGRKNFLLLILAGALISGGLPVLLAQQASIGISGVLYAFIGYAFLADRGRDVKLINSRLKRFFLLWLLIGLALNGTGITTISNIGHLTGLLAGLAFAVLKMEGHKVVLRVPMALLLAAAAASLYMPWSEAWKARKDVGPMLELISEADRNDPDAQTAWGSYLIRNRSTVIEGALRLKSAAKSRDAYHMNNYAWFQATTPHPLGLVMTGVSWAERAAEASGYGDPSILDTLAAAYASKGDFSTAVGWQQNAIDILPEESELYHELQNRLDLYENRQDYTEPYGYDDLVE